MLYESCACLSEPCLAMCFAWAGPSAEHKSAQGALLLLKPFAPELGPCEAVSSQTWPAPPLRAQPWPRKSLDQALFLDSSLVAKSGLHTVSSAKRPTFGQLFLSPGAFPGTLAGTTGSASTHCL